MPEVPIPKVTDVDMNPAIKRITDKSVLGALLLISVLVNLVQGGFSIYKENTGFTQKQYDAITKERDQYKSANDLLNEKYGDLRINFWFKVDSVAEIRAAQKLNNFINLKDGNNTITIKPKP
ncbi:hypothetical protein ACLOAU_14705 [Niabella sp. CJ426]|uniref:hypothetical protein n=1 Tax=Niabella sp. CJ426 TaxID=3393740 RepID=UPI003D02D7AB